MGKVCFPETRNLLINQNTLSRLYMGEKYIFIMFTHIKSHAGTYWIALDQRDLLWQCKLEVGAEAVRLEESG